MDNPDECPDYYRDASTDAAIRGTQDLIDYIAGHPDNAKALVKPAITPRFIPSCTDAALDGLGALAKQCNCHVQTHCSESDWEHGYVLARHGVTDTESLDRFGLLGRRSVLAHANFLSASDMETIRVRESAVAHCPLSNAYFSNAVFPLKAALEKGLHVGLGTDISGGPSGSMFDSIRSAIMVSRMLETGVDPGLAAADRSRNPGVRIDFRGRVLPCHHRRGHRARYPSRKIHARLSVRCHGDRYNREKRNDPDLGRSRSRGQPAAEDRQHRIETEYLKCMGERPPDRLNTVSLLSDESAHGKMARHSE